MSIQYEEGIMIGFQAKYPGTKILLRPVEMRFTYRASFSVPLPNAYETLLWDVMSNDPPLFMRADQLEAAWQLLLPVLDVRVEPHPRNSPIILASDQPTPRKKGIVASF